MEPPLRQGRNRKARDAEGRSKRSGIGMMHGQNRSGDPDVAKHHIDVSVKSAYVEAQSAPESDRYVFAYTVRITNHGSVPARLLTRHWIITDANNKVQEVRGPGVVGEQPYLPPGKSFEYSSGAILETPFGSMRGSYQMIADDGVEFDAEIPAFVLTVPRTLH